MKVVMSDLTWFRPNIGGGSGKSTRGFHQVCEGIPYVHAVGA